MLKVTQAKDIMVVCEFVDVAEQLAIDRAKKLFKADFANVQPHSGASANAAVFSFAECWRQNSWHEFRSWGSSYPWIKSKFSGKIYESYSYGIDETGDIDYDEVQRLANEHKPKLIICGFSAFSGFWILLSLEKLLIQLMLTY